MLQQNTWQPLGFVMGNFNCVGLPYSLSALLLLLSCLFGPIAASELSFVTCGSVIKLLNIQHNVRLHSHDVRYGSGKFTLIERIRFTHLSANVLETSRFFHLGRAGSFLARQLCCGKLQNPQPQSRLCHSPVHHVSSLRLYDSGSGQQSVTGVTAVEDSNSYWSVRGSSDALCHRGTPVLCGQTIRLTHVNTGRNLHSHYFASPLSSNQVCGGDRTNP